MNSLAQSGSFGRIAIPARPAGKSVSWRALLRVQLTYLWRHGRLANLSSPTLFTELVQLRKLHDRDRRFPILADKVLVKQFVADRLGTEWIIPTLWAGECLPERPEWPVPFVVKSRHGCNQIAFVRTGTEDWQSTRAKSAKWLRRTYGQWLDEWVYRNIRHGLLVEPFVGEAGVLPVDFKLYVFNGRVKFIQIHLGREHDHRWIIFDRNWQRLTRQTGDADPAPPATLPAMIDAAEVLAADIDFVRVDFYEIGGRPLFGEMTFYPGSGLDPFDPVSLDAHIGSHWHPARWDQITD